MNSYCIRLQEKTARDDGITRPWNTLEPAGEQRLNEINEKRATGVNETMAGHVSTNRRRGENPTLRAGSSVRWSLSRQISAIQRSHGWWILREADLGTLLIELPFVYPTTIDFSFDLHEFRGENSIIQILCDSNIYLLESNLFDFLGEEVNFDNLINQAGFLHSAHCIDPSSCWHFFGNMKLVLF